MKSNVQTAVNHSLLKRMSKNSTNQEDFQNRKDALLAVKQEKLETMAETEEIIHQLINKFLIYNV